MCVCVQFLETTLFKERFDERMCVVEATVIGHEYPVGYFFLLFDTQGFGFV